MSIDGALVTRSQAGDEEATTELARQVRPLAQRCAGRFFSDPARAEDLAQTAMMKAFARVREIRSPEAFQAWLLRITRNECLNELARQRVAQVPLSTLEEQGTDLEAPAGGDDDPEEALVRLQLQSLVRQVITTLPAHYRRTLTLRALEDATYEEISAELDIPVTVARLWYCRARKRFRQAFVEAMVARRGVPASCQAKGGDIAELIEGTLARADRDRIQGHLSECHVCRQTEDELRSTAFRAPSRAALLGLGLIGLPQKVARQAACTARCIQSGSRLALGAAGTATALVASGAPGGLAAHALADPAAPPPVTAAVTAADSAPAGSAGVAGGRAAGQGTWLTRDRASAGVADPADPGLLAPIESLVATIEDIDLGPALRVRLPVQPSLLTTAVHSVLQASSPVVAVTVANLPAGARATVAQARSAASMVLGSNAVTQVPTGALLPALSGSGFAGLSAPTVPILAH